jgi:hypothetical protein
MKVRKLILPEFVCMAWHGNWYGTFVPLFQWYKFAMVCLLRSSAFWLPYSK